MNRERTASVVNSALWAAYGDALGFITELTDRAGVQRRIKNEFVEQTLPWRRMVGGQFGGQVMLPAGCYSDDTQLRLATCRAIRADGSFDVDAFAKIELTVFDAYSLGAGNASKAAAHALASHSVAWFSNFYRQGKSKYVDAGGNGGVMRIQPHVWCDRREELSPQTIQAIVRNVICSHGHPRALAGALFHAHLLARAICTRIVPGPSDWRIAVKALDRVHELLRRDEQINLIWLPTWEQSAERNWDKAWDDVVRELEDMVSRASSLVESPQSMEGVYERLIDDFGATKENVRGEAMRTAVLAHALAWIARRESPRRAILVAANALGTDTDTIASIVGAILGATNEEPPEGEVLDWDYIVAEAVRLDKIARGERASAFTYPNILTWAPPKSQLDVVCAREGQLHVAGLGTAREHGKIFPGRRRDETWQILVLEFGQTFIIKRRAQPAPCPRIDIEATQSKATSMAQPARKNFTEQLPLTDSVAPEVLTKDKADSLDETTSRLINQGFSPLEIGQTLLRFADEPDGLEKAIALTAIVVKARRARLRKSEPKKA